MRLDGLEGPGQEGPPHVRGVRRADGGGARVRGRRGPVRLEPLRVSQVPGGARGGRRGARRRPLRGHAQGGGGGGPGRGAPGARNGALGRGAVPGDRAGQARGAGGGRARGRREAVRAARGGRLQPGAAQRLGAGHGCVRAGGPHDAAGRCIRARGHRPERAGAILLQREESKEFHLIAIWSHAWAGAEVRWSTTDHETYAVFYAVCSPNIPVCATWH